MLLGDVHGNSPFLSYAMTAAARNGCQAVVQLGDFGYWEHTRDGVAFLNKAERDAEQCELPLLFIDGNHENHALLEQCIEDGRCGDDGVVWLRENVGWITRGSRWEWNGVVFAALGGAASVDRRFREPGWSWWETESICETDVELLGHDPVDVFVCHDAPGFCNLSGSYQIPEYDLQRCKQSRDLLDRAIARTRPLHVVHGHWHRRYTDSSTDVTVHGFGCDQDGFEQAAAVMTLPDMDISPVSE
jgi:hypothetical protein